MATLVRHVMTERPEVLSAEMMAGDAARSMAENDVGAIPITDAQGGVVGLVTDRDLVTRVLAEAKDPWTVDLGSIATRQVVSVSPDEELSTANEMMAEHQIRRLPVVKDGTLVGILSLGDVAISIASKRAVGDTLTAMSEGANAPAFERGPDPGTPDRVRDHPPTVS